MGSVNLDNTGSGSAITLSSDGTSLLLNGTAIGGGGGADLYAANPVSATNPTAQGDNSIAIGSGASDGSSGYTDAIAIGTSALAEAQRSVSLGKSTNSGTDGVGIGTNAHGGGSTATAVGAHTDARSVYATALGAWAQAWTGWGATAIAKSYASGTDSLAAVITNNTSSYGATGANSIAMGYLAKATDNNGIALNGGWANSGGCLAWSPNAKASFSRSIALGYNAFSNADNAIALGSNSLSDVKGKIAFSNFTIAPNWSQGSAQSGQYTLGCQTSDATATTMTTDNSASVSSINQVRLHDHEAVAFDILLVARQDGTDGTACAAWKVVGLINRASGAGTTTLVTSATTVINNTPNWGTPALSADTTNGNLKVQVTGAASTDIAWVATVTTSELTHA